MGRNNADFHSARAFGKDMVSETSTTLSDGAKPGSYAYREHKAGSSTKDVGETLARDVRGQKNPHVRVISKAEFNKENKDLVDGTPEENN